MSFLKDGVTYYEPSDFTINPLASVDGVLSYIGDNVHRTLNTQFATSNHNHDRIDGTGEKYCRFICDTLGRNFIQSEEQLYIHTNGNRVYFDTDGNNIQTVNGDGTNIYADGFIEWSSSAIKTGVLDLDIPETELKKLRPRKYQVAGKPAYGFVLEELPASVITIVKTTKDSEDVDVAGIDVMGVVALLCSRIEYLEAKVEGLLK